MTVSDPVRWGILSTAGIARGAFLPALRAAGNGTAAAVASRSLERADAWAREQGVERALGSYEELIEDESIEAVYIPLPNHMHAEWTIAALRAGKTVLCEKPMCLTAEETEQVLEVARESKAHLWEAFVFPFHPQTHRLQEIIAAGEIGEVVEVQSSFHFFTSNRAKNIRFVPEIGGGALYDVGCYCVRLGRLVLGEDAADGDGLALWAPEGVDESSQCVLAFPNGGRLVFSCGMTRPFDAFSRVIGSEGEVRLTNPFHPAAHDTLEVRRGDERRTEPSEQDVPSFTQAVRHIGEVVRGRAAPEHLAVDEALGNAAAIDLLYARMREHPARSGGR